MVRRTFLETLLKKANLTDAEITETLADLDGDLADDRANAATAALMTADEAAASDTVATTIKRTAKATILDGVDAILKPYEAKLTAAQRVEYNKLGKDTNKKSQYLLKTFEENGTRSADQLATDLKTELDELKANTVPKSEYDTVAGQVTAAQIRATNSEIISAARTNPLLRDVSKDRHFKTNLIADATQLLTETGISISDRVKVKGVIHHETGRLMKADKPDEAIQLNGRDATINDLVEMTIKSETLDWGKKAEQPGGGSVHIDADQKNTNQTPAQKRNLADDDE